MVNNMIKEIDSIKLKQKLDQKDKFYFVDCREQDEWNESHIKGATLIPLSQFKEKYQDFLKDKNTTVVIQCRSGKRSMQACLFLLSQGYKELINLEGGILGWVESGFPVESGS